MTPVRTEKNLYQLDNRAVASAMHVFSDSNMRINHVKHVVDQEKVLLLAFLGAGRGVMWLLVVCQSIQGFHHVSACSTMSITRI